MRASTLLLVLATLVTSFSAAVACGGDSTTKKTPAGDDDDDTNNNDTNDNNNNTTTSDAAAPLDAAPPVTATPIYAHSPTTLYRFDPVAKTATPIGPFSCVPHDTTQSTDSPDNDAVLDVAVDATGQIFATTNWRFIKVDPTNASCTVIRTDPDPRQYPNSLAFVPNGTTPTLMGYAFDNQGGATVATRIDLTTGVMTDFGDLNPQDPINGVFWGMSGDLVNIGGAAGKTFATVFQLTGSGNDNDSLAEIDPTTGSIKQIIGDTGQRGFFGVGAANGKAYGFAATGGVFEIDVTTGAATLALDAKDTGGQSIQWFGAGVAATP